MFYNLETTSFVALVHPIQPLKTCLIVTLDKQIKVIKWLMEIKNSRLILNGSDLGQLPK